MNSPSVPSNFMRNALITLLFLLLSCALFAQVNSAPFPNPIPQFFDANGAPLSGGKLFTFSAGTTSPLATYTDGTGLIQNTNPIILNAAGYPTNASGSIVGVWLGPVKYKLILQNSLGVQQWLVDLVGGNNLFSLANLNMAESTAPSCNVGSDILWGDSVGHRFKMCNNNGTPDYVVGQNTVDTETNKTLISPAITSPTESSPTVSGTENHSGTVHLNGSTTAAIFNSTIYVDGITYPTINAALNACPSAPLSCHVIVPKGTYSSAGFTVGVAPCQVNYAQQVDLQAGVNLTITGQVIELCGGYLGGDSRDSVIITADPSFPTSTPLIDMGDNSNAVDARIHDVAVNCNLVTGCTGIRGRGLNENSYIGRNIIENFSANGILIDGSTVNTANFMVEDNAFDPVGVISGDMIAAVNAGAITFLRQTCNSGVQQTGACVHFSGSTMTVQAPNVLNGNTHCEKVTDCILVDGLTNTIVIGADAENGTVNTIHVKSTFTGHIRAIASFNNAIGACPAAACLVRNDVTSNDLAANNPPAPDGVLSEYSYQPGLEWWIDVNGLHMPGVTHTIGSGTSTSNGTAVSNGVSQAQPAITITGATVTDTAVCSLNAAPVATWQTGIQLLPAVVTANTVTPWLSNPTAGNITPAAAVIRCTVVR